ncbi:MAG: ADP-glyceromanno-heptose 6-epimerase [Caldiserica bacterium]|nr:ADP-glyceromanno-heptose 6-epimerase [Caldisericota bacterium]
MIVVTGGAGFIGSALVWGLNQRGREDILVVDTLEENKKSEQEKNLANLKFCDLMDKDTFMDKLETWGSWTFDGILHMGAISSTTEQNVRLLLKNNYEYTKLLTTWCLRNNTRFLYASTAATYGDGKQGFSDEHSLLPALRPLNRYGYSKHLFDLWALYSGVLERIVGLKYFNVFGPNEYHKQEMRSVVHKAFEQINKEGKVRLFKSYQPEFGDGEQMRDFIYIKDVVDITLFIYDKKDAHGIFNVGTGKARSFLDLVTAIFQAVNKKPEIEFIEMPESIKEKYQYFTQAEIEKLRKLGYDRPMYSLEEGVREYVQDYLLGENKYLDGSKT